MTVFEKNYLTSWIVSVFLCFVGMGLEEEFSEFDDIADILKGFIDYKINKKKHKKFYLLT